MNIKRVRIAVSLLVVIGIFSAMFTYFKTDFDKLPSAGWSKELELFDIETTSNFEDFFTKKLGYALIDESLNIFYVEGNLLKYKRYDDNFNLENEGTLITESTGIDKVYIDTVDDSVKIITSYDGIFNLYSLNNDFELSETSYTHINNKEVFNISSGYLFVRNGDHIDIISNEGVNTLELEKRPYSLKLAIIENKDFIELYHTDLAEGELILKYSTFDNDYERIKTVDVAPFISSQVKYNLLDIQVEKNEEQAIIFLNIKDEKDARTFLDYYNYDFNNDRLIEKKVYEEFEDNVDLISQDKMIITSGGSNIEQYAGKLNAYYNNVLVYSFSNNEYKLLTRTRWDPRSYKYFEKDDSDYLVWGELHNNALTLYISSDNIELIESSQEFTSDKAMFLLSETLSSFMAIPTYVLMMAVPTLAIVMLIFGPAYLIFLSFFERKAKYMFILMVILHNIGKAVIHFRFIDNVDLPERLALMTVPIIIFTSLMGVFNSNLFKRKYKFDNVLHEYIPFFITDIILFTLIFGPYIMLDV